jgi:hypothetical protein
VQGDPPPRSGHGHLREPPPQAAAGLAVLSSEPQLPASGSHPRSPGRGRTTRPGWRVRAWSVRPGDEAEGVPPTWHVSSASTCRATSASRSP